MINQSSCNSLHVHAIEKNQWVCVQQVGRYCCSNEFNMNMDYHG